MSCLIISAKTPGADIDFCPFPFYHNCVAMNIREPSSLGMPFRVTHIVPSHRPLATNLTLHYQFSLIKLLGNCNLLTTPIIA